MKFTTLAALAFSASAVLAGQCLRPHAHPSLPDLPPHCGIRRQGGADHCPIPATTVISDDGNTETTDGFTDGEDMGAYISELAAEDASMFAATTGTIASFVAEAKSAEPIVASLASVYSVGGLDGLIGAMSALVTSESVMPAYRSGGSDGSLTVAF